MENPSVELDSNKQAEESKIDYVKDDNLKGSKLNYLAGTIDVEEELRFKRMIFRITKGNSWTFFSDFKPLNQDVKNPAETVFKILFFLTLMFFFRPMHFQKRRFLSLFIKEVSLIF